MSLELGGRLHMPRQPHCGWKPYFSITVMLALMFVIPHDPSVRVKEVGSSGFKVPNGVHRRAHVRHWSEPAMKPSAPSMPAPLLMVASTMPPMPAFPQPQLSRASLRVLSKSRTALRSALSWAEMPVLPLSWCELAPAGAAPASDALELPEVVNVSGVQLATSVEGLRQLYGQRKHWYGDLDARETRELYHSLLPTKLMDEMVDLPLADRARLAVAARRAARLYARERAVLSVRGSTLLFDGLRQLVNHGRFQPDGLTEEQVLAKYAAPLGVDLDALEMAWGTGGALEEELWVDEYEELWQTILTKSCSTNSMVDALVGVGHSTLVGGS